MNSSGQTKTLLTFWGTRGSISTPGRITEKYGGNTPCVSIHNQDTTIIVDAGTGIRNLGLELLREANGTGSPLTLHLFLSHTHWDHIQGLPFFQPAYRESTGLTIYGSSKKERFLASVLKGQMDYEYFPVSMSALTADIRIQEMSAERIRLGPIEIDWEEQVYHPAGSVRYGFNVYGKRIVFATDVELDLMFGKGKKTGKEKLHAEQYLRFVHGADLLIGRGIIREDRVGPFLDSCGPGSRLSCKSQTTGSFSPRPATLRQVPGRDLDETSNPIRCRRLRNGSFLGSRRADPRDLTCYFRPMRYSKR